MSESDPYASGPQPGDTTYAAYTPPYQTPPPPYQTPSTMQPVRQGGLALPIVSLVCALLALVVLLVPLLHPVLHIAGMVIAVIAVICGHVALSRPAGSRGRGLAVAALAFAIGLLKLVGGALLAGLLRRRLGPGARNGLAAHLFWL